MEHTWTRPVRSLRLRRAIPAVRISAGCNGSSNMLRHWTVRADNQPGMYCAWRGSSLVVLDAEGRAAPDQVQGWFFRETRYLSRFGLRLNGEEPFLCSTAQVNANRLEYTFIYPPVDVGAGGGSGSG